MKTFKKGRELIFKNRTEKILKGSDDRDTGMILTNAQEYSTDFICRWLEFGFVKIK